MKTDVVKNQSIEHIFSNFTAWVFEIMIAGIHEGDPPLWILLGSYLAACAKLASLTQMSAKVHMRSTKEIKLSAASISIKSQWILIMNVLCFVYSIILISINSHLK